MRVKEYPRVTKIGPERTCTLKLELWPVGVHKTNQSSFSRQVSTREEILSGKSQRTGKFSRATGCVNLLWESNVRNFVGLTISLHYYSQNTSFKLRIIGRF